MNSTKFVYSVIAVLVAVIFIGSCLAPTVENAINGTKEVIVEETLTNVGTPLIQGDVSSEYDVKWDSNLPAVIKVNGDVTTVYFNKIYESATVSPSSKEVTVDLTYGELPTPTCDGYTFDGWFTSNEYTTEVTETTIVVGTEDKILYAKWTANTYTVTFEVDGGTVSPASKTVTFGQEYGELPTPTYTGHIFGGWFDSSDNPITSDVIVRTAQDHTLTAVWTLENYLISFTVNDATMGTVSPTEIHANYGDYYTVTNNEIIFGSTTVTASAISPNVFDEWTVSGTTAVSGTVTGAMTFVATFYNPSVTLTFTTDGTTGATVSTASYSDVPIGTEYIVADNTVAVTGFGTVTASLVNGYYFTGWSVAQGIGTVSDAMTFQANYEQIEIADVQCSNNTTWILTQDGKVYGCGYNQYGQQGSGTSGSTTNVTTFTDRTPNGETVTQVACSNNTTWIVTQDGKVYGCGQGTNGQQGSGNTTDVTTFTDRTPTDKVVTQVPRTGSSVSTWFVTQDGKVFGCGYNQYGQQGSGTSGSGRNVTTFTDRTPTDKVVTQVACSNNTTWFVTQDGKVYGCGYNNYGQQGSGTSGSGINVTTFTQRTPAGSINIQPVQSSSSLPLNPIQLSPLHPFTPILTPMSVTPSDVTAVNDWMLGGEQWIIVTVSLTDGDGIALYYAGLMEPLVFDETTAFDFNNGTCTFSHNGTGYTFTYTSIYYRGSGNYVLLDEQAYVKITGSDKSTKLSYYITGDSGAMVDTDGTVTVLADGSVAVWNDPTDQGENSQYDGVFILTGTQINADGDTVNDLAVIVPSATTIEITEEVPAIDPTLAALLVFVVTISIIAVVLSAVRMIGGRE